MKIVMNSILGILLAALLVAGCGSDGKDNNNLLEEVQSKQKAESSLQRDSQLVAYLPVVVGGDRSEEVTENDLSAMRRMREKYFSDFKVIGEQQTAAAYVTGKNAEKDLKQYLSGLNSGAKKSEENEERFLDSLYSLGQSLGVRYVVVTGFIYKSNYEGPGKTFKITMVDVYDVQNKVKVKPKNFQGSRSLGTDMSGAEAVEKEFAENGNYYKDIVTIMKKGSY